MTVSSSDVQRLFIQAVFSRGIISFKHALALWKKCIDAVQAANPSLAIQFDGSRASWDAFITSINQSLNPFDLEFCHLADEQTGVEMYAIVNMRDDEIAQMATDYTPLEIAYFKAVVEQIMLAPREAFSVSSICALREVGSLKSNMTKAQAEAVLGSLVAKGWLLKSKRARYSLSTRALLELQTYIKTNYPDDCIECTICSELVTRGAACTAPNCTVRIHYHCFKAYRATRRAQDPQCPACKAEWPDDAKNLTPVGEAAVKDGQDNGRRSRKSATASDEEEDMRMDVEDTPEPTQATQATRTQRRGKKKAVVMDVDEDEGDDPTPFKSQGTRVTRRSARAR